MEDYLERVLEEVELHLEESLHPLEDNVVLGVLAHQQLMDFEVMVPDLVDLALEVEALGSVSDFEILAVLVAVAVSDFAFVMVVVGLDPE
mgnify:CR=1 FL=1